MTTAALIFAGIAGATIAAGVLAYCWGDLRRVTAEIERWRVATAKLRDGADEAARVATEQLARAEQRVAELEAALREMVDAQDATVEQFTATEIDRLEKAMRSSREILARAKPADLVQEACGGRCGDPLCNLSTEGELMRTPADPFPCRSDPRYNGTDYRAAPAKHADTDRHMLAKALMDALDMMRRPVSALDYDAFTLRNKRAIDAARKHGGAHD